MGDAIVAERLVKLYDGRRVVDELSFRVPEGCVYGFLGRNGAGKSTSIRLLLGLAEPDAGRSWLLGEPSDQLSPATLGRIAYLAENHPCYRWMTVREAVWFARSFQSRWDDTLVEGVLDHFQIPSRVRLGKLSNGQRAQVSLALAVASDPELLILDDPTLGLDPVVRRDFLESLVQIIARPGRTILFSSHNLGDVERIADRIGILVDGALRVDCTVERFKEAVRRVTVTFAGSAPEIPPLAGLLSGRRSPDSLDLVVLDWGEEQEQVLRGVGARRIECMALPLEDAFVAYTAGARPPVPLFAKEVG